MGSLTFTAELPSGWCVPESVVEVDGNMEGDGSSCLSLLSIAGDVASGHPDLPLPPVRKPG